jgi:hypothetical protein
LIFAVGGRTARTARAPRSRLLDETIFLLVAMALYLSGREYLSSVLMYRFSVRFLAMLRAYSNELLVDVRRQFLLAAGAPE